MVSAEVVVRGIVVERMGRAHHLKQWKRYGYRRVVVYYLDGRYYDSYHPAHRGLKRVIVYERGGRYYRGERRKD